MLGELAVEPAVPVAQLLQSRAEGFAVRACGRGAEILEGARPASSRRRAPTLLVKRVEGLVDPRCVLVVAVVSTIAKSAYQRSSEDRRASRGRVGPDGRAFEVGRLGTFPSGPGCRGSRRDCAPPTSDSRSSPTTAASDGATPSDASAAAKNSGEGLPTSVADVPGGVLERRARRRRCRASARRRLASSGCARA